MERQKHRMKMAEKAKADASFASFAGINTLRQTSAEIKPAVDVPTPPPDLFLLNTLVCKANMKPRTLLDTFLRVVCQEESGSPNSKGAEDTSAAITVIFASKDKAQTLAVRVALFRV